MSSRLHGRLLTRQPAILLILLLMTSVVAADARSNDSPNAVRARLEKGEVVVGLKTVGKRKFVSGKILINESPEKVWPIMVNPYEFKVNIAPRMKGLQVLKDRKTMSILKVTVDAFPIPPVTYTVKSKYIHTHGISRIDFWRVGGMLKDFRGHWIMTPKEQGRKCELTYSMYLDPGFFVPQWIMRKGVRCELPKTLLALRKRVESVYGRGEGLEQKTILAALPIRKTAAKEILSPI